MVSQHATAIVGTKIMSKQTIRLNADELEAIAAESVSQEAIRAALVSVNTATDQKGVLDAIQELKDRGVTMDPETSMWGAR